MSRLLVVVLLIISLFLRMSLQNVGLSWLKKMFCLHKCAYNDTIVPSSDRIVSDDNFSDLYHQNLRASLAESELHYVLTDTNLDVNSATNVLTESLVSAADFLRNIFVHRKATDFKRRWFERECFIKKNVRDDFSAGTCTLAQDRTE